MAAFIAEFRSFLLERRKFWLVPILLMSVLLGGLLIAVEGSAVAPFIYTLF